MKRTSSTTITRATKKRKASPIIYDVADFEAAETLLIYGRSGTGKTTFAASFPKPALLINIKDDGLGSVKKVQGLKVTDVGSYAEFEEVYDMLADTKHNFKTVIVDTITQLQNIIVQEKLNGGKKGRTKAVDFGSLSRGEWGDIAGLMKNILMDYRNLAEEQGMNVVFLAQSRVFNGDSEDAVEGIDPEVGPAVSPSVSSAVCAAVNIVANTFIRETFITKEVKGKKRKTKRMDYCLGLGPSASYVRKVRKDKELDIPDHLVDPTYEALIETLSGE